MKNKIFPIVVRAVVVCLCLGKPMCAEEAQSEEWKTYPHGFASNRWIGYGEGVIRNAKSASLVFTNVDDPKSAFLRRYYVVEADGVDLMRAWLAKHILPLLNTSGPAPIPEAYISRWTLYIYSSKDPSVEDSLLLQIPLAGVFTDISDARCLSLVRNWKGVLNYKFPR